MCMALWICLFIIEFELPVSVCIGGGVCAVLGIEPMALLMLCTSSTSQTPYLIHFYSEIDFDLQKSCQAGTKF